ncbi:MAG: hypothetical protein RI918_2148, partial [Pseudomonadota bacterium]
MLHLYYHLPILFLMVYFSLVHSLLIKM